MNWAISFWLSLLGTLAIALPLLLAFFPVLDALGGRLLGSGGRHGHRGAPPWADSDCLPGSDDDST